MGDADPPERGRATQGTLGSPYSVRDYRSVNPELGTLADFKAFVAAAHANEMKVIVDFDYSNTALRRYMAESMAYWVRENRSNQVSGSSCRCT